MPNARARLAPTTSMTTAPTTASTICVWTTAGLRGGVPRRFGPERQRGAERGRERQPDHRIVDLVERMGRMIVRPSGSLFVLWQQFLRRWRLSGHAAGNADGEKERETRCRDRDPRVESKAHQSFSL